MSQIRGGVATVNTEKKVVAELRGADGGVWWCGRARRRISADGGDDALCQVIVHGCLGPTPARSFGV
jgi:hypothetical protein